MGPFMQQIEMPWLQALNGAKWVDQEIVDSWQSYRDAVIWCWENRPKNKGMNEPHDQSMCAHQCGIYPSHFSRSVRRDSKAPMDLDYDCAGPFQAYTGWRGIDQYMAKRHNLTLFEEIKDKRRAA
jgi:hypothetical protein